MRTEDGYIIDKCLKGDPAAFGILVDKYKASIYALAYAKLGNFHDAQDVTQEVFLKAYQKLQTLRRWDRFFAWIYSITSNLCKMWRRSRQNRPDREFIADQAPEALAPSSVDIYREEKVRQSLHDALNELPEMYRQVLVLYYMGGMSTKEIARFLGTPPDTVRQRLSRGRSKLKAEMLPTMHATFDQQKLMPIFTFRIVEMIKPMKIPPPIGTPRVSYELSMATGMVLTMLTLAPYLIALFPPGTGQAITVGNTSVNMEALSTLTSPVKKPLIDRRTSKIRSGSKLISIGQSFRPGNSPKLANFPLTPVLEKIHHSSTSIKPHIRMSSRIPQLAMSAAKIVGIPAESLSTFMTPLHHRPSSIDGLLARRDNVMPSNDTQSNTITSLITTTGATDSADLSDNRFRFG